MIDGGARERDGGGVLAAPGQCLGADAAPRHRRLQVVAGERLALVAHGLSLGRPPLRQQRAPRSAAAWAASIPSPCCRNPSYAARNEVSGGDGVALEQLDEAGKHVRPRGAAA